MEYLNSKKNIGEKFKVQDLHFGQQILSETNLNENSQQEGTPAS